MEAPWGPLVGEEEAALEGIHKDQRKVRFFHLESDLLLFLLHSSIHRYASYLYVFSEGMKILYTSIYVFRMLISVLPSQFIFHGAPLIYSVGG